MSKMRVYDCWEKLVSEVLKQEKYKQMCLADSIESSSISSSTSSGFDDVDEDGCIDIDETTSSPSNFFARESNIRSWLSSASVFDVNQDGCTVTGSILVSTPPVHRDGTQKEDGNAREFMRGGRRKAKPNPRLSNPPNHIHGQLVAAGWPAWLSAVAGEALTGWLPRRADSFEKLDMIGQGMYSTVFKARDAITGKIVALKKVRFDNLEPESVRFMAREIVILRRLDHPNVMKLQGLVTSRMSCSLYLVFDYMDHDLSGLASIPGINFTESQVKCYMRQLLSGLEHCHSRNVLHRDIKASDLLINDEGELRIADFGLATSFSRTYEHPMTNRAVTVRYRAPELLLGATEYGVGVDMWSAGCLLAELFAGKPIMTGQNEMEQLDMIFKICGSPSEEYWKQSKSRVPPTMIKPGKPCKRCIGEALKDSPSSLLPLIDTLLAIDPSERQTATAALESQFFTTMPYACDPSSLPKYPSSKEIDVKRRDDEARSRRFTGKAQAEQKRRPRDRAIRALPAPAANAELQANIDRRRLIIHERAKFPAGHQHADLRATWSSLAPKSTWGSR